MTMTMAMTITYAQVCVLCGPQPSLAELERLIVKSWRPAMPHLAALQVSYAPCRQGYVLADFNLRESRFFLYRRRCHAASPPRFSWTGCWNFYTQQYNINTSINNITTSKINWTNEIIYSIWILLERSWVFYWSTLIGNECLPLCSHMDQMPEIRREHSSKIFAPKMLSFEKYLLSSVFRESWT